MVLKKDAALFARDEEGNLVPQTVELVIDQEDEMQKELEGEKVSITPMPRGKVKRVFARVSNEESSEKEQRDIDEQIIVDHCADPSFTEEEAKFVKPHVMAALVNTIFFHSGLDTGLNRKKAAQKAEDEFAKNS